MAEGDNGVVCDHGCLCDTDSSFSISACGLDGLIGSSPMFQAGLYGSWSSSLASLHRLKTACENQMLDIQQREPVAFVLSPRVIDLFEI